MKKLSIYLFLILFSFSPPSFADDISEFQIEGISIGDSLLDYFSEKEIKSNIKEHHYMNGFRMQGDLILVHFYNSPSFEIYDGVEFSVKSNDKKYKIYAMSGYVLFNSRENLEENMDDCYNAQNQINEDTSKTFKDIIISFKNITKSPNQLSNSSLEGNKHLNDDFLHVVGGIYPDSIKSGKKIIYNFKSEDYEEWRKKVTGDKVVLSCIDWNIPNRARYEFRLTIITSELRSWIYFSPPYY